jgi:hypothetical protein
MMPFNQSPTRSPQGASFFGRNGQATLVALLGFRRASDYRDDFALFYLIGCAYHDGSKSLRHIAKMLRAPRAGPLATELARQVRHGLPKSLRAIHTAVAALEGLTGERLVNRTGEGLGYDALTEAGERLWRLTHEFLRECWA